MKIWLTQQEAAKLVERTPRCLRAWRLQHIVSARKRRGTWEFEQQSLLRAKATMEYKYTHRRIVPGPGRGRFDSPETEPKLW